MCSDLKDSIEEDFQWPLLSLLLFLDPLYLLHGLALQVLILAIFFIFLLLEHLLNVLYDSSVFAPDQMLYQLSLLINEVLIELTRHCWV